jgi:hypothetical protein
VLDVIHGVQADAHDVACAFGAGHLTVHSTQLLAREHGSCNS